eukprot:14367210-Ditylum_brightwellii.AAC.1
MAISTTTLWNAHFIVIKYPAEAIGTISESHSFLLLSIIDVLAQTTLVTRQNLPLQQHLTGL